MTRRDNPPGGQSWRAGGGRNHGCSYQQQPNFTPFQPLNPTLIEPVEPLQEPLAQPPITRARCWEDYDTKAVSCDRDVLASDLNHELAKTVNEAIKWVDQSDPDQMDWYWSCHSELFSLLDTVFLLMKEMDVSDTEASAIATRPASTSTVRWAAGVSTSSN